MKLQENVPLMNLTTIKLGTGKARFLVELTDENQLPLIFELADKNQCAVYVLGEGSNSIATDQNFDGIIILNKLKGIKTISTDNKETIFEAAAGEIWDDFVAKTTELDLTGAEALSSIPGTVGATPVQNVGAYGQETADIFVELRAFDSQKRQFVTLGKDHLNFSYRDSLLKSQARNRYVVTSVTFKLSKGQLQPPFYNSLTNYIAEHKLTDFSPAKIRQYVQAVRDQRIPDYHQFPSAGSFFKNAEITADQLAELQANFPNIPFSEQANSDLIKIPTAWLIDQAGLKGSVFCGIKIPETSPLILVNQSATTHAELQTAKQQIVNSIKDKFDITIEQEPIEIKA